MKGWRTIAFNVVLIALTILVEVGAAPELHDLIGPEWTRYLLLAVFVANIVLRMVTTGPVGKK
jgi:hypothetical protein